MRVTLAFVILAISFIPSLNGSPAGTLIKKFLDLVDPPDQEKLAETQKEIKQIQFRKYSESVFHDSGKGIKEENWARIVDVMGRHYKIPQSGVDLLKVAGDMDETERNVYDINIGGEKGKNEPGTFGYMRIAIEKHDGKLSYILAGTQVKFILAPAQPDKKTTLDLYFIKLESVEETELILPQEMEENLKEYFINKALVAAEKRYGKVVTEEL